MKKALDGLLRLKTTHGCNGALGHVQKCYPAARLFGFCALFFSFSAFAAESNASSYLEVQSLRYTLSNVTLTEEKVAGGKNENKLADSGFASVISRLTIYSRFGDYAFQLTKDLNAPSGYVAMGMIVTDGLELGLGTNVYYTKTDGFLKDSDKKATDTLTALYFGPYARFVIPSPTVGFELRAEAGYLTEKREQKSDAGSQQTSDLTGIEADLSGRCLFNLRRNFSFFSGLNIHFKQTEQKKPLDGRFSKIKRNELTFGVDLLGARVFF